MTERITSTTNPRIKSLVRLRKRRERDATGAFLIEGYRELRRALAGGVEIETLYAAPSLYLGGNEAELAGEVALAGTEVVDVAAVPFRKVSYRDRPEGLLAVAHQFDTGLDRIGLDTDPLLLIVESIEKPGNLGTMLRTAAAAGVAGVIVADPTTDPFNPNVVRASLGTLFTVPLAVSDSGAAIAHLRAAAVRIVATTPSAERAHHEADLRGAVAVVVGSEQYGLSETWLDAADERVVIPMAGPVDSLNAAQAAGIVIFEALRQRG